MKTVITYGTFDLFHIGHLRLLERLKKLGDRLIVGVSTDDFNKKKGKESIIAYQDRVDIVSSIRHVDLVIPEENWEQKEEDIKKYNVDIFGIGNDWEGKFDYLKKHCDVIYLPRTMNISSSKMKSILTNLSIEHIKQIEESAKEIYEIFKKFGIE